MAQESQVNVLRNKEIQQVLYYAGHILASYSESPNIDVFKVNGPLLERLELNRFFEKSNMQVESVNFIVMPRLDWQDREFDTI